MFTWTFPKQRYMPQRRNGNWKCSICGGRVLHPETHEFFTEAPKATRGGLVTLPEAVAAARSELFLNYCAPTTNQIEAVLALAIELVGQARFCVTQACEKYPNRFDEAWEMVLNGERPNQ